MKVAIHFEVDSLEELEKVNEAIKEAIPNYSVKLEIESEELNDEELGSRN